MNHLLDTVRDRRLRQVLESDYVELQLALSNGMNKASLVLAGGIVEAVLINYLLVIGYKHPPKDADPKNMQLADLISACEAEGALTPETASHCQILKSYRNLIHPGRSARSDELADRSRADVAEKLVERVIRDVEERACKRPEWAAEAVLRFARSIDVLDPELAISRKVRALPSAEVARLVVDVLPDRFAAEVDDVWSDDDEDHDPDDFRLPIMWCFRAGWSMVPTSVKADAARRLLRELDEGRPFPEAWLCTFFDADLLAALEDSERDDLVTYVLQVLPRTDFLSPLNGVGPYLSPSAAAELVSMLTGKIATTIGIFRRAPTEILESEVPRLPVESVDAARRALDEAVDIWAARPEDAAYLSGLRYKIWPLEDGDIPR